MSEEKNLFSLSDSRSCLMKWYREIKEMMSAAETTARRQSDSSDMLQKDTELCYRQAIGSGFDQLVKQEVEGIRLSLNIARFELQAACNDAVRSGCCPLRKLALRLAFDVTNDAEAAVNHVVRTVGSDPPANTLWHLDKAIRKIETLQAFSEPAALHADSTALLSESLNPATISLFAEALHCGKSCFVFSA